MTDWLQLAKDRDEKAKLATDAGSVISAALIAIAEELRKLNSNRHLPVITVEATAVTVAQADAIAQAITDQIAETVAAERRR